MYYFNSNVNKDKYKWDAITAALDQAWDRYVRRKGKCHPTKTGLGHKYDYWVEQQMGNTCGFHVCHDMSFMSQQVNTIDFEVCSYNPIKLYFSFQIQYLLALISRLFILQEANWKCPPISLPKIRGEIAAFLMVDVIDPKGEFNKKLHRV